MSYIYDVLLGHLREELDAGPGIDITNGVISATGVEAVGGVGISTAGGTISLAPAAVSDLMAGSGGAAVTPSNLAAALSIGKAVDVTSQPDDGPADFRGSFSWSSSTLGFASFPKFAQGLTYLLIADLTASGAATVSPGGAWLDGSASAVSLPVGTAKRVAMIFSSASTCKLTFAGVDAESPVAVANLREYEVTACAAAAIGYIADLANPDAVGSFYLVDESSVNPWTPYIDMGSSPAVTLQSGLAYKLNATTGSHTLTVDTFPSGSYGRDAHLQLFVGATGLVAFAPPLNLIDALTPNAAHNITIRFRDGQANAYVDDRDVGYVVTLSAGTVSGSLYDALKSDSLYVVFANSLDGQAVDMEDAATSGAKIVVGNGYGSTTLTGGISCTSSTLFTNLAMSGAVVKGGTATFGDVYVPNGGTVGVSDGGRLFLEHVTGAGGGVVDLNNTSMTMSAWQTASAQSVVISGGSASGNGGITLIPGAATVRLSNCVCTGNRATYGGCFRVNAGALLELASCALYGNYAGAAINDVSIAGGTVSIHGGTVTNVSAETGSAVIESATVAIGSIGTRATSAGTVIISSGAIIDLDSSIAPGGAITVLEGGCTVNEHPIAAGTYTSIASDGTTVPPQPE